MRKASTLFGLVGLTFALAGTARAQEAAPGTPVAATTATAPPERNFHVGLSFLPMALGTFIEEPGGMHTESNAAFAPGVAVSVGYTVFRGLSLGLAPQAIFNVKSKEIEGGGTPITSKEFDLMARVAYSFQLVETIALYAEVMPGYSLIKPDEGDVSKGFVLAGGVGATMDMSDRLFVNLGAGYQAGFQSLPAKDMSREARANYIRVALGVGWRF